MNAEFNPKPSCYFHLDINSCFATIEQQDNQSWRNKPLGVVSRNHPNGTILACSYEAKYLGIKTGMLVKEARSLCSSLIITLPRFNRYREVHRELHRLLTNYSTNVNPKSIDEFARNFGDQPRLDLWSVSRTIKQKIRASIGDYLSVSIGLSPNSFLAKTASNLQKPDGLSEINRDNYQAVYAKLQLTDLNGIAERNQARLNRVGIYSVSDLYEASEGKIWRAFRSVFAHDWFLKLRGYEPVTPPTTRGTYTQSYILPSNLTDPDAVIAVAHKLLFRCCYRMRRDGYAAYGFGYYLRFRDDTSLDGQLKLNTPSNSEKLFYNLFIKHSQAPYRGRVFQFNFFFFALTKISGLQLSLFDPQKSTRDQGLIRTVDQVNDTHGQYTLTPSDLLLSAEDAPARVAFGNLSPY